MYLEVWLPAVISIVTLVINIAFYICVQSRLGYEYKRREDLAIICEDFFAYISEIISYKNFDGVPTQIRNYSLKIHLCFENGMADKTISEKLEKLFQMAMQRKELDESKDIDIWNNNFRNQSYELRRELGKYCGGIKNKKRRQVKYENN